MISFINADEVTGICTRAHAGDRANLVAGVRAYDVTFFVLVMRHITAVSC